MLGMLLKLVYSAFLVGLSAVLLRELWTVWADPQLYVGRFEVISETGDSGSGASGTGASGSGGSAEAGAVFARRIVGAQAISARQILDYQTRRAADAPTDATFLLPGNEPLTLPAEALEGIDITIQNVNLRELLTALRRGFRAPNEVRGHVTQREGSVLAAVDWPRAPRLPPEHASMQHFLTPSRPSAQESAAYIACSISWARAAAAKPDVAAFSRAQICDFTAALSDLYALGHKALPAAGLSDAETALVRVRIEQLGNHYSASAVFPELYRLRADLADLLPERLRTLAELVEAQEDRLRYALLSPELRALPEPGRRFKALALARPAVVLEPGPLHAPDNWSQLLARHQSAIRNAAAATGLLLRSDSGSLASAFVVAPGLLMSADFVFEGVALGSLAPATFCLGSSRSSCDETLALGHLLFNDPQSGIAIAELLQHDAVAHPPLGLAAPLADANTLAGRYAVVVGYPFAGPPLPDEFLHYLLAGVPGVQRVMPGRILALGASHANLGTLAAGAGLFTTDISTTPGTAGGPLVDLFTGAVLGVNYASMWRGERGKFSYSRPIPAAALELVRRSLANATTQP